MSVPNLNLSHHTHELQISNISSNHFTQAEFEKFGEIISASVSQGIRKKFPKKKPAAEKKDENGEGEKKEGEEAAAAGDEKEAAATEGEKKEDSVVVTDDEGEKKESAAGELTLVIRSDFVHITCAFRVQYLTSSISPIRREQNPRNQRWRKSKAP